MDTLTKIIFLMNERNCDNQTLATELGLNRQVVTDWKAGRSKSYRKYIYQIADLFGVTVNYLLGNDEATPTEKEKSNPAEPELDEYEKKLLNTFRNTTVDGKLRILASADEIAQEIILEQIQRWRKSKTNKKIIPLELVILYQKLKV